MCVAESRQEAQQGAESVAAAPHSEKLVLASLSCRAQGQVAVKTWHRPPPTLLQPLLQKVVFHTAVLVGHGGIHVVVVLHSPDEVGI
jgi:hypothetical protein